MYRLDKSWCQVLIHFLNPFFLEILDYSIHFTDLDCLGIIQYPYIPSLDFD